MINKRILLIVILIILLGSFLRFYNIKKESFWLDEGAVGLTIKKYNALQILNNVLEKGQILPEKYYTHNDELPVFYIILSGWAKIFGVSEFSLRGLPAILGLFALILIFYLVKYLFDEKIALLSTFLASINLTLIWYSQEARQYSYLLFLSLLSAIFLLKSLEREKTKYIVGFLSVNAFIVYSHFPWIMFIAFEGLYALYIMYVDYTKKGVVYKKIIVALLIIGLLYLPIIGRVIFSKTSNVQFYGKPSISQIVKFGIQLSSWLYPNETMRQKIYDFSFDLTLYEWLLLFSVLLTALLSGLLFLVGVKKSFYKRDSSIFFLLMFFFPISFALILSIIHPKIIVFQVKQMIYIIPAYLIFVSIGILRIKLRKISIVAIIILSILPLYAYYSNIDKQQFREAVKFLPENESIIVTKASAEAVVKYYYGEKNNVIGIDDINILKQYLKDKGSFWVLFTFTKYSDPEGKVKKFLNENYKVTEIKEFFDIELIHYEPKSFTKEK